MKICRPKMEFCCWADHCPDTCCAGWEIPVDEESLVRWQQLPSDWRETMEQNVEWTGGEAHLRLAPDGRCMLLDEQGLCRLYAACGEESLCRTCHLHPSFVAEYGSLREIMPGLSCPAWSKNWLMSDVRAEFVTEETEEEVSSCNEIDGLLFYRLKKARDQAVVLLQDRSLPLTERVRSFLTMAQQMDGQGETGMAAGRKLPVYRRKLQSLEILTPRWQELLQQSPRQWEKPDWWEIVGEQVLVYALFRFFLKGVYDGRCLPWAKLVVLYWLAGASVAAGCVDRAEYCEILRLWAKELEHSGENMEALHRVLLRRSGNYSAAALLQAVEEL